MKKIIFSAIFTLLSGASFGQAVLIQGAQGQTDADATKKVLVDSTGRLITTTSGGTGSNQVQGTAAAGAAVVGNPVQVGGKDGSGNAQPIAVDTSGNQSVVGNVASGVADSGNPVKAGGIYNLVLPTFTSGQRADLQLSVNGSVQSLSRGVTLTGVDAWANSQGLTLLVREGQATTGGILGSAPFIFNGTSWDRTRGNVDTGALITATGATSTQTSADQVNYNGRGVQVVLDTTVIGTGSVTLTIQGKDTASGKYYTILSGAAVVTNVTNVYTIYPGNTVAANVSASTTLPRTWRVVVTANNANAATYTVGASVIL